MEEIKFKQMFSNFLVKLDLEDAWKNHCDNMKFQEMEVPIYKCLSVKDKKYTEEDVRDAINVGIDAEAGFYPDGWNFKLGISLEDYFINSLNKTNDK